MEQKVKIELVLASNLLGTALQNKLVIIQTMRYVA